MAVGLSYTQTIRAVQFTLLQHETTTKIICQFCEHCNTIFIVFLNIVSESRMLSHIPPDVPKSVSQKMSKSLYFSISELKTHHLLQTHPQKYFINYQ